VDELFFANEASRSEVHFKYIRDRLRQDPHARRVLLTYRRVLRGEPVPDNPQSLLHNALKLAGLVERGADGALAVRNPIYRRVFDDLWVRQTLAADPTRRRAFALGVVAMLLVVGPLGYWLWGRAEADVARAEAARVVAEKARSSALVQALLTARPEAVPNAIANLQPFQARAVPQLRTEFDQAANSENKLNAALALAAFGKVDVSFLLTSATEAPPGQCMNIVRALEPEKTTALAEIPRLIAQAKPPAARARLATVALFLDDLVPLKELTLRNPNPTNRTAFIHGYREWPGDPLQLAAILQTVSTNSGLADFRSALGAALALVEWKTLAAPEQAALVKTLRQLYTESPDSGTHSAAACALTRWGQALPEPPAPTNQPPAGRDWFVNRQGMTMLRIPAGKFNMGSASGNKDEQPVHEVTLTNSFFISDREVTVAQFRQFTNSVAHDPKTPPLERLTDWEGEATKYSPATNCPVQQVSWFDAVQFCNWLSRQEGRTPCYTNSGTNWQCNLQAKGYRLPTEAEWEYTCRAVSQSHYTFGDDEKLLGEYAWYSANSSSRTWPAGSKLPNLWGAFDLHGNLWEWCQDWYASGYYKLSPKDDPAGLESGEYRVLRGGSWGDVSPRGLSGASRFYGHPDSRTQVSGFCCVLGVGVSAAR
jgi:formylglycine-generating enzyme required for sulfatase activity